MGFLFGGDSTESKNDDTNNLVNNVVIDHSVEVHNDAYIILLYIIAGVKIVELIYMFIKFYNKQQKKKYLKRGTDIALN